jgi:transcriptional regulator with XRE-family HTH domain
MNYDVNGSQLRAGRVLLGWTIDDLARNSQVSKATILKYEGEGLSGHLRVIRRVLGAMDAAGITFEGRGVNLKTPEAAA